MKLKKILLAGLMAGAMVALVPAARASIIGSPHDFTSGGTAGGYSQMGIATFGSGTNAYNNPCQVCHIPHKAADPTLVGGAPLWNHAIATNAATKYVTYDNAGSAHFNSLGLGALTLGSSVACLSCHDGSIAINQSYGKTTFNGNGGVGTNAPSWSIEVYNPGTGKFDGSGTYLTRMHPIGVSYSAAAAADPDLVAVASLPYSRMLKGVDKTMECASCHDIHRTIGASATATDNLIVDINGGQLCLTCHNK